MKYIISRVTYEGLEDYINRHCEHDPDSSLVDIKYLTKNEFIVIISKETRVKPKREKNK